MKIIQTHQLQLADRVIPISADGVDLESGIVTVKNIADGTVHLFRPYTHTAGFSTTSGVICYVGIEEYSMDIHHAREWHLISRTILR
jgi:hypothetical protein